MIFAKNMAGISAPIWYQKVVWLLNYFLFPARLTMMSDEDEVDVLTIEPHPDNDEVSQSGVTLCLQETIGE